ncbi:MAG: DNA polymerase III subunit delta [bacterium]|nr:MAG: DNA polymerase III subunit delta [bacterium]
MAARRPAQRFSLKQLERSVNSGKPEPVYFFHGSEEFRMKEAVNVIKTRIMKDADRSTGWCVYDLSETGFDELLGDLRTVSFFGGLRGVMADNLSIKGERGGGCHLNDDRQKRLVDYIKNPSPDVALILCAGKIDMRLKFWKTISGNTASAAFESSEWDGKQYAYEKMRDTGLGFLPDAKEWIAETFANDTKSLNAELEKLAVYMGERKNVSIDDLEDCMNVPKTDSIFKLTDAIASGSVDGSLRALSSLKFRGEPFLKIIPMMAWQFRMLLKLKSCEKEKLPPDETARRCGVNPFMIKKNHYIEKAARFTIVKLELILHHLSLVNIKLQRSSMNKWTILEQETISLINKTRSELST